MAFSANQYSAALFYAKLNAMADTSSNNTFTGTNRFTGQLIIGTGTNNTIVLSPTGATFNTTLTMGSGTTFNAQNASQVLVPTVAQNSTNNNLAASIGFVKTAISALSKVWNVERTPNNVPFDQFTSGMNVGDIYVYVALPNWDGVVT